MQQWGRGHSPPRETIAFMSGYSLSTIPEFTSGNFTSSHLLVLTFKLFLSPKTYKAAGSQPCVIIALSMVSTAETRFESFSFKFRMSSVAFDMFALEARDFCFAVALFFDTGVAETIM